MNTGYEDVMVSKKWLPEVDLMKAAAIILIVSSHMDNYLVNSYILRSIDSYLALIGLSFFFFISGFTIHHPNQNYTLKKIGIFYKNKFYRIYPLYWSSLILCVVVFELLKINPGNLVSYDIDLINFVVHMFGMQVFFTKYTIQSMWFIGVISLYYFFYSVIIYFSKNEKHLAMYSFLVILPFIFLRLSFNLIDIRVFIYYSAFIGGILSRHTNVFDESKYKIYIHYFSFIFALILLLRILSAIELINYHNILMVPFIINSLFVFFLSFVSYWIVKSFVFLLNKQILNIFFGISYGSYVVYLFHHEFLATFRMFLNLLFNDTLIIDSLLILLGLPILFMIGYLIQKLMNNFITIVNSDKTKADNFS